MDSSILSIEPQGHEITGKKRIVFGPILELFRNMNAFKLNQLHLILIASLLCNTVEAGSPSRITHSRELLGSGFHRVIGNEDQQKGLSSFVQSVAKRFLPKEFSPQSQKIAKTLIHEAETHGFDPVFLLAMIQNESSFNPRMIGSAGEIGLMQIKPDTAQWIAKLSRISYHGKNSLFDPVFNIRIGVALLSHLRSQFDSASRLYVSAYNLGAKKVKTLVSRNIVPKEYVKAVMKRYLAMNSALREETDPLQQGELAWMNINQVTRSFATN